MIINVLPQTTPSNSSLASASVRWVASLTSGLVAFLLNLLWDSLGMTRNKAHSKSEQQRARRYIGRGTTVPGPRNCAKGPSN
jgi:hypothetical protein